MHVSYPDVSLLPEDLGQAVCRMVRLVNQMHERYPELDRFALAAETALDRRAAEIVAHHVNRLGLGFEMFVSPYDPAQLPHAGPAVTAGEARRDGTTG